MAKDIYELVRSLGFERAHIVGHDIGGMIAYSYAADYPAATQTLTILDVPLHGTKIYEQIAPQVWWFDFHRQSDVPEALTVGKERDYLDWFYKNQSANPAAITEDSIAEYVRCYSAPGGMRAGFGTYCAFPTDIKNNTESLKTKLKMPVLALGGEQGAAPFIVSRMQEAATNVSGGAIKNAGNFIAEEQPQALAKMLSEFLGKQ